MKYAKLVAMGCAVVLGTAGLTGCSKTTDTTGDCSGGIQTTGGGTTNASNLDVETEENSSAAIRSDRGSGTVNVDGGTYQDDSENIHNIMIYQSMSGDAEVGEASFTAEGGSITAKSGDMFYVTNTDCTISLKNVAFKLANEVFLRVEGNSSGRGWGQEGSNGGDVVLNAEKQTMEGRILVDEISSLKLNLTEGSSFTGSTDNVIANGYHLYVDGEQVL